MNPKRLLQYFEQIADAPDAVPRLRQFILDLAVRGKMVEQDPGEEPAIELLKRIDKARAVTSEVDRRAESNTQEILGDEHCWEVPSTWNWRGLADLALFIDYRGKTPAKVASGVRLITAKNVRQGFINFEPEEFVTEATYSTWMTRGLPRESDILFTTEAPMGNVALIDFPGRFALAQRTICFRVFGGLDPRFMMLQILSPPFQNILDFTATGLTAKGIKAAKLKRMPFAIPPLVEQHRIVAKVDELMVLCDQLEVAQQKREKRRDRLVAATLHSLNHGTSGEDFRQNTRFYFNHLPSFTTRPEHIQQLRQTILNLAVQGKLVPQEPNDEPASSLMERFSTDREQLIRYGKVKRKHPLSTTKERDAPFSLPAGWVWARLQDLLQAGRGISYGIIKLGPEPKEGGIPTLRCSDVRARCLDLTGVRNVSPDIEKGYIRTRLEGGEVLLNIRGTMGGVAAVPQSLRGYNIAREVAVIPFHLGLSNEYLVNVMASSYFWGKILDNLRGLAYKGINLNALRMFEIPLPPLAEQHRIVKKVDELIALCDQLEARLTASTSTRSRLLEATLYEALSERREFLRGAFR